MDKKIEILENTLLKLLVRRGTDGDRVNVILSQGELGYTTDTKRLYIGDGATPGGVLVGNKFTGPAADVTTLQNVMPGDYGYDADARSLLIFIGGDSTNINNWLQVANNQIADDGSIIITGTNTIKVGLLSAGNFSSDALGSSLVVDVNGRLTVNPVAITTDKINTTSITSFLELPGNIKINNLVYRWPNTGIETNKFLTTDATGTLSWANATSPTSVFVSSTAGQVPVGSIMPFVSASRIPEGWLICNGASVLGSSYRELSAVIGNSYGGNNINFNLPNYVNKTLYGVDGFTVTPSNSTLLHISSSFNSALSATGIIYIIKHKSDNIVNSTITIGDGLSSTRNGLSITNIAVSPLSGNFNINLPPVITAQKVVGGASFDIDKYGRVTTVDNLTSIPVVDKAGTLTTINSTPVYNAYSSIGFLQTPVIIHNVDNTATPNISASFITTISAYPKITTTTGVATLFSIPSNAKNLIVNTVIRQRNPLASFSYAIPQRIIAAAPSIEFLNPGNVGVLGSTEYLMLISPLNGSADGLANQTHMNSQQSFIPLSANASGDLTLALRGSIGVSDALTISIVGYTL